MKVVILSGISGSGKTTFLKALEDAGFFCVDNLPLVLLQRFLEAYPLSESKLAKPAFVVDIRERAFFGDGKDALERIREAYDLELIFLESDDEVLFRRFKETRRTHPLYDVSNIRDALKKERQEMGWMKEMADKVLDTSFFTTNGLRNFVISTYGGTEKRMRINLISFGYAYGIPLEGDIVQDVRFLPNPFFVEGLRQKTGLVHEVSDYVKSNDVYNRFFPMLLDFLVTLVPLFEKEGKSYLTICVGCTGGKHRSVSIVNELEGHFRMMDYKVAVTHRDIDKEDRW
jgi:RNase adapter protein RapZ